MDELLERIATLESELESGKERSSTMDEQVALMEKSYELAAKYMGGQNGTQAAAGQTAEPVSYTHLDVYKRQVRKYFGEAIVVTQEVDDIISSPVVKESIINNSDCKILLDQRKYMNKFDQIQALLGLTEKEKSQILSINMANNPSRLYKEVWIGLGGTQSAVYATEVSAEEYLVRP